MIVIQRSDIGVAFIVTITNQQTKQIVNLSSATNIMFIFKDPFGNIHSVTGSFYTNGQDGKVQYISQSNDLLVAGLWKFQVSYNIGSSYYITNSQAFQVAKNLYDIT